MFSAVNDFLLATFGIAPHFIYAKELIMNCLLGAAVKIISACCSAIVLSFVFITQAQAVVINFDDLTYVPLDPDFPSFGDTPLYDQYRSQGLLISNAYLLPYAGDDEVISGINYLLAGASGSPMVLSFVGDLPTYVGMYIGGGPLGVLYTNAYGPSGLFASLEREGSGWRYVSFTSVTGIARIEMYSSQQQRVSGATIDDLTYTYGAVPESSSLVLLAFAVIVLFCRRSEWIQKVKYTFCA